jgi:hypothetical protein
VPADFDTWCAQQTPPVVPLPIWWRNSCVSYDVQEDASRQVPYDTAVQDFATAFSKWTSVSCADAALGSGAVSIQVVNLGPVACDQVQYNRDQGNQHVIIFHDTDWPYPDDMVNTLGLTTITFDPHTGEIYDADMEINATVPLTVSGPVPPDGYDFLSIITHETGHFLGMAHSADELATMYAHYTQGSTSMRNLTSDDTSGICSIYAPDGMREVAAAVESSGTVPSQTCDPTPRHGFQSECAQPPAGGGGCSTLQTRGTPRSLGDAGSASEALASALALVAVGRRTGRRRKRGDAST